MPELPEVETVVRELRPRLVGRRIAAVKVSSLSLRSRWSDEWGPRLVGRRVRAVERRGKWILLALDGQLHLVIHLGMTGQLTVVPGRQPLAQHTHVVVDLDRGREQLRFRDIRRFGSATLFDARANLDHFFRQTGLGPEPFDVDAGYWRSRLAATSRCLKAVLLDQRVVAGVGNIYADESLYEARLHPARPARETSAGDAGRLGRAVIAVLRRAIDKRGSSIRDYVGGSGRRGEYQREFRVYGRPGQPCPRCRGPIERIRLAGRSTHFCPHCQRL
ncbi:MAG TPA: bifunctional DNA-formamidopyrimidine glycosylase/DNA-(apurinic or apyrimidinic site) lyase [Gemmataceae bacterium]|nr:bifunctional DNA-formamidopyrimidine glycosylase/DNA-(apurinic or apyrimidinic site) lyase [Gemmataceae bacterium]